MRTFNDDFLLGIAAQGVANFPSTGTESSELEAGLTRMLFIGVNEASEPEASEAPVRYLRRPE